MTAIVQTFSLVDSRGPFVPAFIIVGNTASILAIPAKVAATIVAPVRWEVSRPQQCADASYIAVI